ncbi:MAG: AAA family ATPase [Candidatus Tectimicrobiota bacterium]
MLLKEEREKILQEIVGREQEVTNILATLEAGKHIILEGAPGTTKSTILRTITKVRNIPFYLIEGNIDLTPSKLVGHFNPSKVMADDYRVEYFEKGPLTYAMEGGYLYIEEFNRVPADTANVLIMAVEEGEVHIPRYGTVKATPEFRVICAQNPYDDVGTMRVSRAIYDRFCRVKLNYQSLEEELDIVTEKSGSEDRELIEVAVHIARETRNHSEVKQGASIRGALDMVAIAEELFKVSSADRKQILEDAMMSAMSGKVWLQETAQLSAEEILRKLLQSMLAKAALDTTK